MLRRIQGNRLRASSGAGYILPETQALVARFTTPPSLARTVLINNLISSLITAGVWAKLDALYVLAQYDAQAARQNWIANQYNLTAVSSPTFTADRGYQGDGASSYLETGFNPSTAVAPKFTQNSAHMLFASRTAAAGSGVDIGNSNSLILTYATSTGNFSERCNAGTSAAILNPAASGVGRYFANRVGAGSTAADGGGWRNGFEIITDAGSVSAAVDNNAIRVLGRSGAVSYSARQCSAASLGSGLSDANVVAFDAAINTYLTAVGAA